MDVAVGADIDGDGVVGVGHALNAVGLGFAHVGPGGCVVVGELYDEEGEVAQAPGCAPVLDEGGKKGLVFGKALGVCFALVPDGAADGEVNDGENHAVVEHGGGIGAGGFGRLGGELQGSSGLGGSGLRGGFESGIVLDFLDGFFIVGQGRGVGVPGGLMAVEYGLERGDAFQAGLADPGFDIGAAPGAVDEADGDVEFAVELFAEVIGDAGEAGSALGRADLPFEGGV